MSSGQLQTFVYEELPHFPFPLSKFPLHLCPLNYLSVEQISKSYGVKVLFEDLSFGIERGQKVALIARNGTGKSTLLKCLIGKESPDEGNIVFRKGVSVGFLHQDVDLPKEKSILDAVLEGESKELQAIRNYEHCALHPENSEALQRATDSMDALNAWDHEARIAKVLGQLGVQGLEQQIGQLSGGQQKRVALAKVLIMEPDLLVLDEPTNHLDLDMIEWLEEVLSEKNLTLLMVTHDRYFLDHVCDEILELDSGQLYRYKGNYSYFLEKKALREEVERANVSKAKSLMRKELEWVRRMPKARGTKAKYRMDAFQDLKERARKRLEEDQVQLRIKPTRLGTKIIELHKVSMAFGANKLIDQYGYVFKRNERMGIVGRNGTGKSTFLKLITGELQPTGGKVVIGDTVTFGHYRQEGVQLKDDKKVIDVIRDIAEWMPMDKGKKLTAAELLERFLFDRDQQYHYVSTLSGGEKRRLHLLTVLMKNPNVLILDEPTNDLDIYTLNALEEYLMDYRGVLVVVSHDRYFMDKITDHLLVFQGDGKIKDIIGNYTAYRKQQALEEQPTKKKKPKDEEADIAKEKTKLTYAERIEMKKLEKALERLEEEKERSTAMLMEPRGHEEIQQISEVLTNIVAEIDEKTARWMELAEYA